MMLYASLCPLCVEYAILRVAYIRVDHVSPPH